jgi:predicted ATPase
MGIAVDMTAVNGDTSSAHFAFEVNALPGYGFSVEREQCVVTMADSKRFWFDRRKGKFASNVAGLNPSIEEAALCLPVVGGDKRFAAVLKVLGAMRGYSIEPSALKQMQDPDSGAILKFDGSNAASVLQELVRTDEHRYERVREILEAVVPNTEAVHPKTHGNKLSLEFTQVG